MRWRKAAPVYFGAYEERGSNLFKIGEPIITYLEPVGFHWKEAEGGQYAFALAVDFVLKNDSGKILGGQERFQRIAVTGHSRATDFMLHITMNLRGAPPGKYVLTYTLRDENSDKRYSFDQPVELVE